ncbi:MAG TPA: ArsA family ATPase [Candidatus Binataceae bacterium]
MLTQLLARRVLIVLGKGGVGKTAVSAALGMLAAESGKRVLIMECDGRAPMAAAFGHARSLEPVEVAPNLSLMVLDGISAFEEYLRMVLHARVLLRAVFANRFYQFFVQAAPGVRELMMLGKVYYEANQKSSRKTRWDLVIVDAPASGQALSLLRMPTAARESFGDSIVGHEAANIARMLRDKSHCAIVAVTTPEPLAVSETLETMAALERMRLAPAALFFNRTSADLFDARDVAIVARAAGSSIDADSLAQLAELATRELKQAQRGRKTLAEIRAQSRVPAFKIREHSRLSGAALMHALAAELAPLATPGTAARPH